MVCFFLYVKYIRLICTVSCNSWIWIINKNAKVEVETCKKLFSCWLFLIRKCTYHVSVFMILFMKIYLLSEFLFGAAKTTPDKGQYSNNNQAAGVTYTFNGGQSKARAKGRGHSKRCWGSGRNNEIQVIEEA